MFAKNILKKKRFSLPHPLPWAKFYVKGNRHIILFGLTQYLIRGFMSFYSVCMFAVDFYVGYDIAMWLHLYIRDSTYEHIQDSINLYTVILGKYDYFHLSI